MSSSAINTQVAQLKAGNVQNQADTSAVYSAGVWSFKNSTALPSVTITDAGNVGIGTSSPVRKLDVVHPGSVFMSVKNSTNTVTSTFGCIADSGWLGTETNHPVSFYTNSAPRMTLDASGNVGVGVTPSSAPTGSLFVKRSISGTDTTPFVLYHNSTLNAAQTADTYINNGTASRYYQNAGAHIWQTAASGLAGNNITWSDTMRIDASGRLMVGATSSDYVFRANGFSHFGEAYDAGQYGAIQISRPQATGNKFHLACISSGLQVCGLGFLNNSNVFAVNNAASSNSNGVSLANGGTSWSPLISDIRKKKNFETTQGLTEILQIEPVKYHLLDDEDVQPKRLGFKAQNLQPLIPEMVIPNGQKAEDGSDYLTITPDYLLPVLVKAIQELSAKVDAQAEEIKTLKAQP